MERTIVERNRLGRPILVERGLDVGGVVRQVLELIPPCGELFALDVG